MNFTYTITKPPDEQYGSRMKNNSWTGMVHMLQKQEIDLGMYNSLYHYRRSQY